MSKLKTLLQNILELLFPSNFKCFVCEKEIASCWPPICEKCNNNFPRIANKCSLCGDEIMDNNFVCLHCKNRKFNFNYARAPFRYEKEIAARLKDLKFNGKRYVAKIFAPYLYEELNNFYLSQEYKNLCASTKQPNLKFDVIVPVPIHKNSQRKRGYNQSTEIANALGELAQITVLKDNLIKNKANLKQTELDFKERQTNVENCYELKNANELKGKNIILIDDIFTTGATANECSKLLKKAKAKSILVLTVAHTNIKN